MIAIKLGAFDYLAKPADGTDEVFLALMNGEAVAAGSVPPNPMSAERVRWEHLSADL